MMLSHRIALDPTDKQRAYFAKAAGCDRFCWNLALEEWNRRYDSGEERLWGEMLKTFNAFKYYAFPWMLDIHRDAHTDSFERLAMAWRAHFKYPKTTGKPKFHKKGGKESFYVANDRIRFDENFVALPVVGRVRICECVRLNGKIMSATVSRIADRWFVSIKVNVGDLSKDRTGSKIVGVDLGIKSALTLSTGEKIDGPKPLKKELRKLRHLQRKASRQVKGGKNQKKTYKKVARIHARCANIRKDFWHKETTRLCRENQAIAIEDLNVAALIKSGRNSKALGDIAIGMMKPMLSYKSKIYGNGIVQVDRWFPSSKMCSVCGLVKDKLGLKERMFECDSCGAILDRDVNAAINLRNKIPEDLGKLNACGLGQAMAPHESGTTMSATRRQVRLVATLKRSAL